MATDTTVTAELPAELYERFVTAAARTDTDPGELLSELIADHVALVESVAAYTDREDGHPSPLEEAGPGAVIERPPPVGQLVGFDLVSLSEGRSVVEFEAGPHHANPMGTLHGGVLCDVGDAAMGTAFASTLDVGESFTTLELGVHFLKPVWEADLTATGEVVKRGRQTGLVECTVTDEEGSLVAKLDSTCLVLRGEAASGR